MLSEEEKKAIEIVKKIKNIKFNVTSSFYSSGTISLSIEEKEAIETALNLITKLQKENEEKDKQIDLMAKKILTYQIYNSNLSKRMCNKCQKKDFCYEISQDCIKQYFENKVEAEEE